MARDGMAARIVFNDLDKVEGQMRARAGLAVRKAALDIEAHIKASMEEPKTGKWYGDHQASAPGEAPAVDMGELVNSVQAEKQEAFSWLVFTDVEYAPVLEFGGRNVAPRPSFGPAADAVQPSFEESMEKLIDG